MSSKSKSKNPAAPQAASLTAPPPADTATDADKDEVYELVKVPTKAADDVISGRVVATASTQAPIPVEALVAMLPQEIMEMGSKGRGMILGVNTVLVLKAFALHLAAARIEGNPAPLVYCGVLSVAIAYTVSRDWVEEYGAIPSPHMFSSFEIEGRAKVKATETSAAVDWVANSNMNAAALRVFGSMIVEAGQGSSFLKYVKETAGTIYNPPTGEKARDVIMKEANKSVSEADRQALAKFVEVFQKYAVVVGTLFGGGDTEYISYVEAASALGEVTI